MPPRSVSCFRGCHLAECCHELSGLRSGLGEGGKHPLLTLAEDLLGRKRNWGGAWRRGGVLVPGDFGDGLYWDVLSRSPLQPELPPPWEGLYSLWAENVQAPF